MFAFLSAFTLLQKRSCSFLSWRSQFHTISFYASLLSLVRGASLSSFTSRFEFSPWDSYKAHASASSELSPPTSFRLCFVPVISASPLQTSYHGAPHSWLRLLYLCSAAPSLDTHGQDAHGGNDSLSVWVPWYCLCTSRKLQCSICDKCDGGTTIFLVTTQTEVLELCPGSSKQHNWGASKSCHSK